MAVTYDPSVIHQHAQQLYDRARTIIVAHGALGALFGLATAAAGGAVWDELSSVLLVTLPILFGALGVFVGRTRSFELRLEAQTALCQVQIELNSRARAAAAYAPR